MDYLEQLCQDLQIPLERTDQEPFSLRFSEKMQVQITPLSPGVSFYSILGKIPPTNKEPFFLLLMTANLFGQGTKGASLGLEGEGNLLTVSFSFPYDMDYKTFKEQLEDFVNIAYYWQEELEKHTLETSKKGN